VEHDALVAHVNQRVRGTQVDGNVVGKDAAEQFEHARTGRVRAWATGEWERTRQSSQGAAFTQGRKHGKSSSGRGFATQPLRSAACVLRTRKDQCPLP